MDTRLTIGGLVIDLRRAFPLTKRDRKKLIRAGYSKEGALNGDIDAIIIFFTYITHKVDRRVTPEMVEALELDDLNRALVAVNKFYASNSGLLA